MDFRHEWKHEISYLDMLMLRQRLRAVAQADQHTVDGKYLVRSLYFDTPADKALLEKLSVDWEKRFVREKEQAGWAGE